MTYDKLNPSPEKYQKFYLTTPTGEQALRKRLELEPDLLPAVKKRLAELEELLKLDDNRCHASRDQRNFLRRILAV